jgi:hypothetical protein
MTLEQSLLLLNLVNAGIDTALKMQLAVDKIMAMTDAECRVYNEDQNLISDMLMKELDTI